METVRPQLTLLQQKAMQELQLAQNLAAEILARAVWFAHTTLPPGIIQPYRNEAHRRLAAILNEVEWAAARMEGQA